MYRLNIFHQDLWEARQPAWHFFVSAEWQCCFPGALIGILGGFHSDHSCQRWAVQIGCIWSSWHWQCVPAPSPKSISNWTFQQQSICLENLVTTQIQDYIINIYGCHTRTVKSLSLCLKILAKPCILAMFLKRHYLNNIRHDC